MQIHNTQPAFAGGGITLLDRIYGNSGSLITQAGISSISLEVNWYHTGELIATDTPTVADVVFDTLQTDFRWDVDCSGYNFRYAASDSMLPQGGRHVLFKFTFTPTSGAPFIVAHLVPLINTTVGP